MIKLKIIAKDADIYKLQDDEKQEYCMNIEFFDMEELPEIGNYLYINKEYLNPKYEGYSGFYIFGDLASEFGKSNIKMNDIDIIKIEKEHKLIYLKRLYG